ncbi:hypothetical protein DCAR_0521114 [Daucus carota subsp. sativus]|uniref:Uncharacterized protein n=1 Tax=Daucus carota subsp. sativus TaxID=79200 RepID=A0A162A2I9_DAUCS|nr:hypothetical protein DCAR_0521114 [Daucus carota subsp. sativus]
MDSVVFSPNPTRKRKRRLGSNYVGRRLSFSDDQDHERVPERRRGGNSEEDVLVLLNSLDIVQKMWMEHQKRLRSTRAALKEEWDNKIRILMSMR